MSVRLTVATSTRVLQQIRHDRRTLALLLIVPCVLLGLLAWIYQNTPVFDEIGAPLLGMFPFLIMFLVTSIATLRERQSGTLERLLTMPLGKADLIGGYAVAFGLLAALQAVIASSSALLVLGLDPVLRHDLWAIFRRLAEGGVALLVSSHVMDEAIRCDRLLLMRAGTVLADDTLQGVLASTGTTDAEQAFLALVDRASRNERAAAREGPAREGPDREGPGPPAHHGSHEAGP